jgi:hypothetical protein
MGLLKPKLAVQKCGRTTGIRKGTVNGFFLQSWDGGVVTTEIAILGKTNFADKGDSGSCVITDEDFPQAVGMVIGDFARGWRRVRVGVLALPNVCGGCHWCDIFIVSLMTVATSTKPRYVVGRKG